MLQVTLHETPGSLTFQLDGRLAGPWVRQLEGFLHRTLTSRSKPVIRFDLSGVTMIDEQGKVFLAIMRMEGAELLAGSSMMTNLVATLSDAPVPAHGDPAHGDPAHGSGDAAFEFSHT
ncbi:MAG: hypothetical protein L0Y71_23660 [Gemmataceae bacterium]|nr:hypothetical protein [Gemmataceae bacterium]